MRDRIVQTAVRMVVEPIFEREFAEHSYGFRPGRGCKDALRRVDELLQSGLHHVVDVDIKGYFDSIPHDRLMALVRERIADGRVLTLIESFLKQGIMNSMGGIDAEEHDEGTPQGGVVSPLLANIYLNPLDQLMSKRGHEMVRYADDGAPRATERAARHALSRNCTTDEGRKAPRDLLAGAGHKSPSAAVVKSHGGEHRRKRPGKNQVR